MLDEARARLVGHVPLGGSQLSRATVRAQFRGLVSEYVSSHDASEVVRRLTELRLPPDLMHELVRGGPATHPAHTARRRSLPPALEALLRAWRPAELR